MNLQIAIVLLTIVVTLILFALKRVSASVTGLGVLLFLIITGLLPVETAFDGFGSDLVLMILGIMIMAEALGRTGVTGTVARWVLERTEITERRFVLMVMVAAIAVGAFLSNTAATALFLPVVIGLVRRAKLSPAKFLMPLAFASILASSLSLIGTSTNIVVSGMITERGLAPLGMFELTPVGLPIALVGLGYMFLLGRHLVPDRIPEEQVQEFQASLYFSELLITEGSPLEGKRLSAAALGDELNVKILRVIRDGSRHILPRASTRLQEGDALLVEGAREDIMGAKDMEGIDFKAEVSLPDYDVPPEEIAVVEAIVLPGSPLVGRTLEGLDFHTRYELQVLALNRHGETLRSSLSEIRLNAGDVMVLQGVPDQVRALERQGFLRVLDVPGDIMPHRDRAIEAVVIFVGSVALATASVVPMSVAMLLGALLTFITRCITPEEAYSRVNWKPLILIACMLGLGKAMELTGTADYLADLVVYAMSGSDPVWLLAGFFGLTVLLTQPMSNQASAVVVLPVALQTAQQLGFNPRSFAMTVALAASCSFLTPLEPACLLVYGPGRYRFLDFLKVGALLTLLIAGIVILMVPWVWPLTP
ncbi:MAG: SLC13 family permease [Anaerolineae bacterium]